MPESSELCFATSNRHKYLEARFILRGTGLRLRRLPSKGTEVQSDDIATISRLASAEAAKTFKRPLFVEDTALSITALNGFPGPYAAYVLGTIGREGVLRLMRHALDRSAEFASAAAYCDGSGSPRVFTGRLGGSISEEPRGDRGFGFDAIFVPEGRNETLAEMSLASKCAISHRSLALKALASWLQLRSTGEPL
jgi:XTP/dITP diphosphohydrolase